MDDLFNIGSTKVFSGTKLVCDIQIISSIVARQFTVDAIAQVNIDHLVVFTRREKSIARILNSCSDSCSASLASLLGSLSRVLDFSNLVPFALCIAPHKSKRDTIFFENLDETIRFAAHFSIDVILEIR